MTGSLQIKSGTYYAVVRIPDAMGCEKQKWVSTGIKAADGSKREVNRRKRDAEKRMVEIISRLELQKVTYSQEMLFVVWIEKWLEQKKYEVRSNTLEGYQLYFKKHIRPYFIPLKLTLQQITPQHLQDYYNSKEQLIQPKKQINY